MSKILKNLSVLIVLPLLMLLTGCNSEGAFSDTPTATLERIVITPSTVRTLGKTSLTLATGHRQEFVAVGHYSDDSSRILTDLSMSHWHSSDRSVGFFDSSGWLVGGNTQGIISVYVAKDGIISNTIDVEVTAAVLTEIDVTPSIVSLAMEQTEQLTATAIYSDGSSSDVSSVVTWKSADTATATVDPSGLLTGVEAGETTVTAILDDITSNTVNVDVCSLADVCLDIFDTGNGKLFTNSPSVAYLDSIGGSESNGIFTVTKEDEGPSGDFYLFDWNNANALCSKYNAMSLDGRTNWRLPTKDELKKELYDVYGNMYFARAWGTGMYSWTSTPDENDRYSYYFVGLHGGYINTHRFYDTAWVTCVSEP